MRKGEFRATPTRAFPTLAILGMANSVASWFGKEKAAIERIGSEFVALALQGLVMPTPKCARADMLDFQ